MKSWLYVGARVVCVDASPRDYAKCNLVEGVVYTVTQIMPETPDSPGVGVRLAEVKPAYSVTGFYADRFAPVTTINTDDQVEAMRRLMQKARDDARQGLAVEYR